MNNSIAYTNKTGERVDIDALRLSLEIIADDIDTAELLAREAGDVELAYALDGIFHDMDRIIPGPTATASE